MDSLCVYSLRDARHIGIDAIACMQEPLMKTYKRGMFHCAWMGSNVKGEGGYASNNRIAAKE
eukprot:scaffold177346_cov20-Attheya_sp.AAC.1